MGEPFFSLLSAFYRFIGEAGTCVHTTPLFHQFAISLGPLPVKRKLGTGGYTVYFNCLGVPGNDSSFEHKFPPFNLSSFKMTN